jgi:hypothetical protein
MRTFKASCYFSSVIFAMVVLFASCGGRQEGESRAITDNKERTELAGRSGDGLDEYPIPTSVEIVELLQRAGAPYILGISNPVANVDKYFTERSKALNLGVYGADLSYAGTYEMNQEIMKYLQVSKQLIEELNISTSFNRGFVERVERNLEDKDSLINIVSESFNDTYVFLTRNNRDDLALLVMTGSMIEGMFLTSQIAIGARDNSEITDIIIQQREPLEKLLELLDDYDDDYINTLHQELQEIHNYMDNLRSPMTNEEVNAFADNIERLRAKVIA